MFLERSRIPASTRSSRSRGRPAEAQVEEEAAAQEATIAPLAVVELVPEIAADELEVPMPDDASAALAVPLAAAPLVPPVKLESSIAPPVDVPLPPPPDASSFSGLLARLVFSSLLIKNAHTERETRLLHSLRCHAAETNEARFDYSF